MSKYVFIINGVGGSGKDSFVEFCKRQSAVEVFNISSIDPVKQAVTVLDSNFTKTEAGRKFLAEVKRAWSSYNDGPTTYVVDLIEQIRDGLVFVHIREPEEISKCQKALPNTKTLLIKRPHSPSYVNGADDRTEEVVYDFIVENNSDLEELKRSAAGFLRDLGLLSTD